MPSPNTSEADTSATARTTPKANVADAAANALATRMVDRDTGVTITTSRTPYSSSPAVDLIARPTAKMTKTIGNISVNNSAFMNPRPVAMD
jgi:hypothetical protein